MSFKDGDLHTIAAIGSAVAAALFGVGVHVAAGGGGTAAASTPPLEDLEAIEASIAVRKKPVKLPQKKVQEAAPDPVADKVNRDADRMPDPPKDKPPQEPKLDPKDPLKGLRRDPGDDSPVGKPTDAAGAFNDNERGFAEETKGHPFFQRFARDISDSWEFPKILSATKAAVGCFRITPEGKIAQTRLDRSGESQLDQSVEEAVKKVETKRNSSPEQVPEDLLKSATTRWICFNFNPQSRTE